MQQSTKSPTSLLCPIQVNKYAFSGGRATIEEHRERGADLDVSHAVVRPMSFCSVCRQQLCCL